MNYKIFIDFVNDWLFRLLWSVIAESTRSHSSFFILHSSFKRTSLRSLLDISLHHIMVNQRSHHITEEDGEHHSLGESGVHHADDDR